MEKPFCIGESIARENVVYMNQHILLPKLSVEDEIKMVVESKKAIRDDDLVLQKMRELGIQR